MAVRENAAFMRNNIILILIDPSRTNARLTRHNDKLRLTVKDFTSLRVNNGVMIFRGITVNFLSHIPSYIGTRFKSHITDIGHAMTPQVLKLKRDVCLTTATSFLERHFVREIVAKQNNMIMRAA